MMPRIVSGAPSCRISIDALCLRAALPRWPQGQLGLRRPKATIQGPGVYRSEARRLSAHRDRRRHLVSQDRRRLRAQRRWRDRQPRIGRSLLPPNVLPVSFTVLLVNTGSKLVMIDAGTGGQVADTAGALLPILRSPASIPKPSTPS